ncbi:MAG TPA: hypothetical protein VJB95_00460 [Candidatus Paceibacterota bacterium]
MGFLFFVIWYMIAVLPFYMLMEGWGMLKKVMGEKNWWWKVPYVILLVLVFILTVLLTKGYR